jgi:hypothetical protein
MLIVVGMLWIAFGLLRPSQIEKARSPQSGKPFRNAAIEIRPAGYGSRTAAMPLAAFSEG